MAVSQVLPRTDDPDTQGFWAAAREGKLVVQKCSACGRTRFPPHPYCAECRQAAYEWQEVSGYARVWTYAFAYKPTLPAFEHLTPYPVAYVELEDQPGLRMAGNLVAGPGQPINSVPQDDIHVGLRVKVSFEKVADDVTLPLWTPVAEA